MILNIKNMVCDRCIMVIRQQLEQLNFKIIHIFLGGVEILPDPSESQISQISSTLKDLGFELIDSELRFFLIAQAFLTILNIVVSLPCTFAAISGQKAQ